MTTRTADEALANYVEKLGPAYGAAFHHGLQRLWVLSSYWDRYEALYGTKERVAVLNFRGGEFWHAMQLVIFDHVLLGICRLTDPARTGKRENLTLARLLELDPSPDKARLRELVDTATRKAEFARSWRNNVIAHNDLHQLTGVANKLDGATRNKVRDAIVSIHDVFRYLQFSAFGSDLSLPALGDPGAEQVLATIDDGNDVKRQRMAALERKDYAAAKTPSYGWAGQGFDIFARYRSDLPHTSD